MIKRKKFLFIPLFLVAFLSVWKTFSSCTWKLHHFYIVHQFVIIVSQFVINIPWFLRNSPSFQQPSKCSKASSRQAEVLHDIKIITVIMACSLSLMTVSFLLVSHTENHLAEALHIMSSFSHSCLKSLGYITVIILI